MIAGNRWVILGAFAGALAGHAGLAMLFAPPATEIRLESASGAVTARLGSGFSDLVAGVQTPEPPRTTAEKPKTPDMSKPQLPYETLQSVPAGVVSKPRLTRIEVAVTPDTAVAPVPSAEKTLPTTPEMQTSAAPEVTASLPEITASLTVTTVATPAKVEIPATATTPAVVATPVKVELTMASPPVAIEKPLPRPNLTVSEPPLTTAALTIPPEVLKAQTQEAGDAPRASLRPLARPRTVEPPVKKQKPAPRKTAREQPPVKQGNAEASQRAGAETGSKTSVATTKAGKGRKASQGNAAVSNYPGKVLRRISRVRRPKVRARGVALVSFTIAKNGGLASVRIGKSSGSAELDGAALQVVRRAAPFPPPPTGAKRSFVIPVKGR